jgi:hypothetical protein
VADAYLCQPQEVTPHDSDPVNDLKANIGENAFMYMNEHWKG